MFNGVKVFLGTGRSGSSRCCLGGMHPAAGFLVGNEDAAASVPASPNNMRHCGPADLADVKELEGAQDALLRKQPGMTESSVTDAGPEGRFRHWLDRDQPRDAHKEGNEPEMATSSVTDAGPYGRF